MTPTTRLSLKPTSSTMTPTKKLTFKSGPAIEMTIALKLSQKLNIRQKLIDADITNLCNQGGFTLDSNGKNANTVTSISLLTI